LAVSSDPDHQFDLALSLGDVKTAHQLASEADSEQKWKQLVEIAIEKSQFGLAQEALHKAKDMGGLLLLASCAGLNDNYNRFESLGIKEQQPRFYSTCCICRKCENDGKTCFNVRAARRKQHCFHN